MARTIDQKSNHQGFPKAGELVELRGAYALTLQDRRIFNVLVEHAGSAGLHLPSHRLALWELRRETHKGSERVRDSLGRLMRTIVEIPYQDSRGRPAVLRTALLAGTVISTDEDDPGSEVRYSFSPELREVLLRSEYWARIRAAVCFAFSSKYALRLYEAVALRINRQHSEQMLAPDELRELLGVEPGKLPDFPQLKQRAITPAVAEVNEHSPFHVEVQPLRKQGKVRTAIVGYRLRWKLRGNAQP